jgi:zinc/manganese transport system permease protein
VIGDLKWMIPPLAMCLVLTGIHGYLGIHVLSRKVIFVDLALAQIAALGSTFAHLLGYDAHEPADAPAVYFFSLGFTLLGAAIFALTRMRHERVPQEAFIGIVYAVASALAILLLSKSPGESEQIKEMLVGNVLLVTWPAVAKTAALYAVIGAFHFFFRKTFFEISFDPDGAVKKSRRVRLWDFAFYASFGVVITSSVAVAGVLLVFSFLVVPAVVASMFADGLSRRIVLAWVIGSLVSTAGMLLSYHGDLPTGPSVVACFAAVLTVSALTYYVRGAHERWFAFGRVAIGAVAVVLAFEGLSLLKKEAPEHAHEDAFHQLAHSLEQGDEDAQIEAIHHLEKTKDPHAVALLIDALEKTRSERVIEHILEVLPEFGDAANRAAPALFALTSSISDPMLKVEAAAALIRLHDPRGAAVLRAVLDEHPPAYVEEKARELLQRH